MVGVNAATWGIAGLATFGVIVRPWNLPEFIWAMAGATLLVLLNLLPWPDALAAAAKGTDVYFFLIGMMLLAEVARKEGLFDWLAARAVQSAKGSAKRLFLIVYIVGTAVTVLLSNDATAVVLTPAVYAATRAAKVEPLPYLFICAFIANAASFVLPISNPANLVVFGSQMPPLFVWLHYFMLPSVCAIAATYVVLRLTQRRSLDAAVAVIEKIPPLTLGGKLAAAGIALTAVVLLGASALGRDLGLPTFVAGTAVTIIVLLTGRQPPMPILKDVSWSVLPLVAGLFILVEGLNRTGVLPSLAGTLREAATASPQITSWVAGVAVAVTSNLVNNLPMGLIAATTSHAAQVPTHVTCAILIGVDLGPNLSVTGSLATILWLIALRREREHVAAWQFLELGLVVMPPALLLALLALPGADASIGGMVATRASGTNAVRYGTMRDDVVTLQVVLADGSVIDTGSRARKSSAGYDLTRLFVGSEGTLGVITEVTVKLHGIPETTGVVVASFHSIDDAAKAAIQIMHAGIAIARVELMDALQMQACRRYSKINHPEAHYLFMEFHGSQTAVLEQVQSTRTIAEEIGCITFASADTSEKSPGFGKPVTTPVSRRWH
jgi:arsenical pump membrane protein